MYSQLDISDKIDIWVLGNSECSVRRCGNSTSERKIGPSITEELALFLLEFILHYMEWNGMINDYGKHKIKIRYS